MSASAAGRRLTSRRHPLIQRIRRMAARPSLARRAACFLADGIHLCEEALAAGQTPETLLWAPRLQRDAAGQALLAAAGAADWPLQPVTDELLESVALTDTPQGVLGVFPRPPIGDAQALANLATHVLAPHATAPRRLLGLDRVQDPVNLGVLARAAWAFGCRGLLTLPETVDPLHPRALRASSGMILRLPLATDVTLDRLSEWCQREQIRIVRLATRGGRPLARFQPDGRPLLLLVGSEGHGFSPETAGLEAEDLTIEIRSRAESLGVAAAGTIALYSLDRLSSDD